MNTPIQTYQDKIIPLLRRYNVRRAAFFGSLVDGRFSQSSDVDMLVLPPAHMSLLDFVGLKQDIEDHIGRDVDLVSYNGISPYLRESILSEQHIFYEADQ